MEWKTAAALVTGAVGCVMGEAGGQSQLTETPNFGPLEAEIAIVRSP
jgi:hypothetical protein